MYAEAAKSGPVVFLSYRRDDTRWTARGLHERLADHYGAGNVFRDIDAIPPGVKFRDFIAEAICRSDVFVLLIGRTWTTSADSSGQLRLRSPRDPVRVEVEIALRAGVPIIPVCVEGAAMPTENDLAPSMTDLLEFNGAELTDSRWDYDVDRLIEAIDRSAQAGLVARAVVTPTPAPHGESEGGHTGHDDDTGGSHPEPTRGEQGRSRQADRARSTDARKRPHRKLWLAASTAVLVLVGVIVIERERRENEVYQSLASHLPTWTTGGCEKVSRDDPGRMHWYEATTSAGASPLVIAECSGVGFHLWPSPGDATDYVTNRWSRSGEVTQGGCRSAPPPETTRLDSWSSAGKAATVNCHTRRVGDRTEWEIGWARDDLLISGWQIASSSDVDYNAFRDRQQAILDTIR